MRRLFAVPLACLLLAACQPPPRPSITQAATIDALLAGAYDGYLTLGALRAHGDFGIGTFHALDGELILLDGVFYKVRGDGAVVRPPLSETTPFATVTRFVPDLRRPLPAGTTLSGLEALLDELLPQANRFLRIPRGGGVRFHARAQRAGAVEAVPAAGRGDAPSANVRARERVRNIDRIPVAGFRARRERARLPHAFFDE
jgi:alpha-acetolactate decarboxylase